MKLRSTNPNQPEDVRYVDVPTFRQMADAQVNALTNPEQRLKWWGVPLTDLTPRGM